MTKHSLPEYQLMGIAIRTSNEANQAEDDLKALWIKFLSENIYDQIPHKVDTKIYCFYTDYQLDHTQPYTAIIGCMVSSIDMVPENMFVRSFPAANYLKFTAKGAITQGIVAQEWHKIWNTTLDRSYICDYEVYDERAQEMGNAEVDIFIGIN